MSEKKLNILIAAGGTGGHLFPAMAVADELKEKSGNNFNAYFVGNKERIEGSSVPKAGYPFFDIPMTGLKGKFNPKNITMPIKILRSISICNSLIKRYNINAVLCAGAYLSYPAGISATLNRIPLILMESNVYPGKSIKALSTRARLIFTAFAESEKYLKKGKNTEIICLGNPVRKNLINLPNKSDSLNEFNLKTGKKTVLIFGGSLGARSINEGAEKAIKKLPPDQYQFIWQTGKNYEPSINGLENVKVLKFIDNMAAAYSAADLIVSRSGATSLAEIAVAGKPSILVPYPLAANNHQEYNADLFADRGASVKIIDRMVYDVLGHVIDETFNNSAKIDEMQKNVKEFANPEAAKYVCLEIINLLN